MSLCLLSELSTDGGASSSGQEQPAAADQATETESTEALSEGIVALQGWLREAEAATGVAITEAEVAKKARRAAEKQAKDGTAALKAAEEGREEAEAQYKALKRELDQTVRQLRGVQQSQDDVNSAVTEENAGLTDQLTRLRTKVSFSLACGTICNSPRSLTDCRLVGSWRVWRASATVRTEPRARWRMRGTRRREPRPRWIRCAQGTSACATKPRR